MKIKLIIIFEKPNNQKQKNVIFQPHQYLIYHFGKKIEFKACKSVEIDAIGIEVAQKMKLSGCLAKGHSSVKSGINTFLSVKRPFIGQPDNFICLSLCQLSQSLQICML